MTPAEQLLEEMQRRGVRLTADGDHLEVKGLLSDQDVERLEQDKAELLELLHPAGPPRRPARVTGPPTQESTTHTRVVRNPAPDLYEDVEGDRMTPARQAGWHQPNVRRQAVVRATARDETGRFLPRRRQPSAEQMLADLEGRGVDVWQRNGELNIEDVRGALTRDELREIRQLVKERREELLTVAPSGRGWFGRFMYGDGPDRQRRSEEPEERHPNLIA